MRRIIRGSLFVACIGVINLASVIGIPARGDVVTDWNNAALDAIRADRTAPPIASRSLAIVHVAIYDAVNGIARTHEPYLVPSAVSIQCVSRSCCQRRCAPDACQPVSKPHIYLRCASRRDSRWNSEWPTKDKWHYVGRIRRNPNPRGAGE